MAPRRSFITAARLRDALAAAAALLLIAVVVLWVRSQDGTGDETYLDGTGNRFHFLSRDGYLIAGVYQEGVPSLWRWPPRRTSGINTLISDPSSVFTASPFGWGLALPHWLVAGLIAVIPAWWWLVRIDHAEDLRRFTLGLCRHCGYDLRASPEYCPECGAKAHRGVVEASLVDAR